MSRDVMETIVAVAGEVRPLLVDITGGAPELNPDIRYLLRLLHDAGLPVRLRTNLTALLTPEAAGLIGVLAEYRVALLASLPAMDPEELATQGRGPLDRSLESLRSLTDAGYGSDPRLRLDIAVNRSASALEETPAEVESRFRKELADRLGIRFNDLLLITNVPVGRFRDHLHGDRRLDSYLEELREAFNPETLSHLACRTCISVAWDGTLWDCDFNLGHGITLSHGLPSHIADFDVSVLANRPVRFAEHCFACTAMAGSG